MAPPPDCFTTICLPALAASNMSASPSSVGSQTIKGAGSQISGSLTPTALAASSMLRGTPPLDTRSSIGFNSKVTRCGASTTST